MSMLASFSQSNSFLTTRIALLTFYEAIYSEWSEKLIVLLEYLQLASQDLLTYSTHDDQASSQHTFFTKVVMYFFKLINPSALMTFQGDDSLTYTILLIVICSMMLKYLLAAYVSYIAYRNRQGNALLLILWQWIFRIQSRILCYLITSFWTSIILLACKDIFTVNGMDKAAIIVVATILLTIEYKFSVLLEVLFCYRLPTKNFLSSKSYRLVMITLCQKIVLQIIQLIFQGHFGLLAWLLSIANLLFTLIRGFQFYGNLPLYGFRALLFQGDLLSLVMSLNITMFIQNILKDADYRGEGSNFIVIAWIIIGILIYKLSREYLLRSLSDLLISSNKGSAETLLHKISALKQLKDILKLPSKKTKIYDFTYLLSTIKDINIQIVLSLSSESSQKNEQEPNTRKSDNKIYLQYLQDLSCKFPRNSLVKLYIAKLCSKDPELYAKAMNIIIKLTQEKWSESFLTVSLLRYEVEKAVMNSNNNNETTLDLLTYINSQICVDKLTKCIQTQIDLKITVCDNILGEKSNIGLIFNNAQLISKYKAQTQKQIDQVLKVLPSSFIEPYLICAGYFKVLGDSLEDYDKFNNLYLQKLFKYGKSFQTEKLNEENLYQENNVFLIVSGEKSNNGQIHYSSQSIENVFGGGKQISYNGTHISTLFTPNFHSFYSDAFRDISETEKGVSLNQVKQVFLQHKSGHMIFAELYVKIHPYLTRGMYLDVIMRPVPSAKEYLILKEDGTIEGATKSLANELGLKNFFTSSSAMPNIRSLSEELWVANQAFNTMGRIQTGEKVTQKRSSLKVKPSEVLDLADEKRAINLFKTFSGVKTVELSPIRRVLIQSFDGKDTVSYDCNLSIMSYGPALMKLVTLEKINTYEGEQVYGSIDIPIDDENNFTKRYTQNPGNQESEGDDYLSDSGNINSPEKVAGDSLIFVCRQETYVTTHGNLLSPSKRSDTNRQFLFSSRGDDNNAPPQITTTQDSAFPRIKFKKEADLPVIHMNPLSSNQANPTSSQNKTASTTFRTAVGINFHPKSFTPICLMFYTVIVITFVSQVVLKVVSDNIMATLIVKKNLLTYSQLRTFKVMLVSTNARLGVTSIMAPDIQGGALFYNLPDTVTNVLNHTIDLNTYNNQMKLYASLLDKETQQELYLRNVKVYDFQMDDIENSPYRFVNNFEVIDETVEKVYKLTFLSNPGTQEALRLFYSIRYNMVDDFLYKSEMITDFLTETVQSEKEYLELMIMLCLIIIPLLLMGIVLLVTLIIWRQYLIEKKNMLAFIKLKPDEVTKILVELKSFKKNLQNKDYTEYQKPIEIDDIQPGQSRHEPQRDQRDQRERRLRKDEKEVNYSEIRTRYFGYFGKVAFYVMALIGILVWNFISARNSTRIIYNKQDQLNFASEISEVAGTQYMAAEDLFQSNNSAYVKHEKPLNLTIETQAQLKNIQSQAPSAFLELNGNYDPSVQAQLYNDNCLQYDFSQVRYLNFCYYIQKTYGQRANLISLMAYYYGLLQGKLQDWYNCDKSTLDNLVICVYINVNAVMPSFVLIFTEAISIGDTIRAALDKSIKHANYERDAFLIAFSVSLVAASLLIWYQILAKLKEGYNDFKKVLQLFPPKLILSSFQLKKFLLQHSNLIKK